MASIIIDGAIYPAESGREIVFDRTIAIEEAPPKLKYTFGDGYSGHVPLGSAKRKFNVTFKNREDSNIIENYFQLLKGESFPINIKSENITVIATDFSRSYNNIDSVTATLEEYFG
jgi:phage-related protein